MHGIVAYRSTFLRPNVCEKKLASFCQVLKQMHTEENRFLFFLRRAVDVAWRKHVQTGAVGRSREESLHSWGGRTIATATSHARRARTR